MNAKMKFYFCFLCLALGMTMFVSSCKDDEDDIYNKEEPEITDSLTQEDRYRIAYEGIVKLYCDSLINGTDTMLVLNCGQPSPDGKADTRYVFVEDTTQALELFLSQFSPAFSEGIEVAYNKNEVSVSLGNYGYIKFMLNSTDPIAVGMAEIKLKRMPNTMYIQYVPGSKFGADYMSSYSPYYPGYVLNINGELWLCTTAWNGGSQPGTLLRFTEVNENNLGHVKDDYIDVYYQKSPASKEAFIGLQNFILHNPDREALYNFVKNIKNLKDAQYLSDVMRIAAFEPYDESKQLEDFKKTAPDLYQTLLASYPKSIFAFVGMSFFEYCKFNAVFGGYFFSDQKQLIFLTDCNVSGKYSRWIFWDAHDITMQYVIISYDSFVYKSYTGKHDFNCGDFSGYYFKDKARYMSQMKTFSSEEIKGAEIVWPTMAQ